MARCFAKTNPNLVSKKLLKTFVTSLLKVRTHKDCECDLQRSIAEFGGQVPGGSSYPNARLVFGGFVEATFIVFDTICRAMALLSLFSVLILV